MPRLILFWLPLLLLSVPAHAAARVVASIKPLHSLVAAVMEGDDAAPQLLVDGTASPHSFTLRPSQMRMLQDADIVFYIGDTFEMFMARALDALPPAIRRVPLDRASGMTLYPPRLGQEDEHHHAGAYDLHVWLSVANTRAMAAEIARRLAEAYPEKESLYIANARKLDARLDALDRELHGRMMPLKDKPFVAFHDAYQYFEKAYGLSSAGAILLLPDRAPGAKHLSEIRQALLRDHVACVFSEPQFDRKVVENVISGTPARIGSLDPEGALLAPGPDLYFEMMHRLAKGFEECLSR